MLSAQQRVGGFLLAFKRCQSIIVWLSRWLCTNWQRNLCIYCHTSTLINVVAFMYLFVGIHLILLCMYTFWWTTLHTLHLWLVSYLSLGKWKFYYLPIYLSKNINKNLEVLVTPHVRLLITSINLIKTDRNNVMYVVVLSLTTDMQ